MAVQHEAHKWAGDWLHFGGLDPEVD